MKMKKLLTLLILLAVYTISFGKHVDEATAKQIGKNFLVSKTTSSTFKQGVELEIAYISASKATNPLASSLPATYFYIFNVKNGDGFVMVAADDNAIPILGYSDQSDFIPTNISPQVLKWFEEYKDQMRYIIQNKLKQTPEITKEWEALLKANPTDNSIAASVSPLMTTQWNQSPYVNAQSPYDNGASELTVTGCVATAMAQVMKFWNYPAAGTGYHSYNHSRYGTLSANFGSTTYNWSSMPNKVSSANSAVATLMYHCGVSVDMNFDIGSRGGSGAYVITAQSPVTHCTEYAMEKYFGYKTSLKGVERKNYTTTTWLNALKAELNAGRPIVYAGFGGGGGHCFVNDGYDNNDFLHFNWGWGGAYDGYFSVNALNPGGVGIGGGTGGFNSGHQAVIGIEPPAGGGTSTYDMRLYQAITVNPDPIKYSQAFDVTLDIANFGTSSSQNFTGEYTVAVFNSENNFVATVETKTNFQLNFNSHYTNPLVFSTTGLAALTPGDYKIGLYYKPTGTTKWVAVANGAYSNFIPIKVEGSNVNPLKLYAAVTSTPTVIVRNKTFTVDFDIANFDTKSFDGEVSVDIHKSDGTWIRELDKKTALSLPTNTHFTNGLSYTISSGISDEAGTYQLFIWSKPNGGDWEPVGNGAYANPITIQVVEPALTPDAYEVNNTSATSYKLTPSFTGNTAKITTQAANCHTGNDYDYYKIELPAGYDYTITSRIHDVYANGTSNTYTFDGLVSYSTDGTAWSDAYDNIISGNVSITNGGTIYYFVSPYFTGATGTYQLEANITRTQALSTEKDITGFSVAGIIGNAVINPAAATVTFDIEASKDVTTLTPTITVSNNATINPPSGAVRNFTNPVTYTVTAQDGSTKDWTITATRKSGVGIDDIALTNSLSIYPNPATDKLTVDFKEFDGVVNTVSLISMDGKVLLTKNALTAKQLTLDVNAIAAGFYMLQIQTNKGNTNKKVLIK